MRGERDGWTTSGKIFRFAARLLLKDRWFTLPAVIALAFGIGMNGTMFTIVNAMIRGLPIDRPDRIMSIHARDGAGRWRGFGVSYLDFLDFRAGASTFSGLAAFSQSTVTLSEDGRPAERASSAYVSANTLQLLGDKPALGRDFVPATIGPAHQRSSSWAAASGQPGTTQTRQSSGARSESTASPPR